MIKYVRECVAFFNKLEIKIVACEIVKEEVK